MSKLRLITFFLTIAFVGGVGFLVSLLARGYRFDSKTLTLKPRGLFVVTSSPDGAQIFVDNELESATNATISLPPKEYDITLKKDGYHTWLKHITIKEEEVTKIEAFLFPAAPSLSALTFTGAINPVLSPDSTKIAYGVALGTNPADNGKEKVGIWIMDLVDLPIGFSREPRRITDLAPIGLTWRWSPDTRQLLLISNQSFFLLDTTTLTLQTSLTPLTPTLLSQTFTKWKAEEAKKEKAGLSKLPEKLREILANTKLTFAPDEKKVFYTAITDATLPEKLISPLPGSSTQKEAREIRKGKTYVYDLREDRNFAIFDGDIQNPNLSFEEASMSAVKSKAPKTLKPPTPSSPKPSISWFPTSNHLVVSENNKITIVDYDGTNPQVIYQGPYETPFAFPFPNTSRLLILTNLGAGDQVSANLYGVSLK